MWGCQVLPEKLKDNFMEGRRMGKVTCRSPLAWGPASMQALRGRGFLMSIAASAVLGADKTLSRELANGPMKMGTCVAKCPGSGKGFISMAAWQ